MAVRKAVWRHRRVVSKSFWLRRRAAALAVTFTAPSGGTVFVWLLVGGALVGLWYALHVVSAMHNATLTWTTGVCLVVLFLLCIVPASGAGYSRSLKYGATVVAIVNPLAYAYRVADEDHLQAVRRSDIKSVRRMFGVVALAGRTRSEWLIVPADLFPTRAQWRKLTGRGSRGAAARADRADSDVPKWGG